MKETKSYKVTMVISMLLFTLGLYIIYKNVNFYATLGIFIIAWAERIETNLKAQEFKDDTLKLLKLLKKMI